MSQMHYCVNCGCPVFKVNGWTVTEPMVEGESPHQPAEYGERAKGKVDIVEVVCCNCGEPHQAV